MPKESEDEEEEEEEEEEESDFKVALDEDEMCIYHYLKEDSPLPEEQVITLVEKFWREEPYKYVCSGSPPQILLFTLVNPLIIYN